MARIQDILNDINNFGITLVNINDKYTCFSRVEMIGENTSFKQPDCLYVGTVSAVSEKLMPPSGGIYLLIADEAVLSEDFQKRNTIIFCEAVSSPDILYSTCTKWLANYSRYLENSEQIFDILLNTHEDNLYSLLDKSATLIKNPLILLDANCKILAFSQSYEVEDELWKQNIMRGYCTYEQIVELQSISFDSECGINPEKCYVLSSSFYQNRMGLYRLKRNNETMGTLIILEENTPFSKIDRKLAYKIAQTAAAMIYHNYERLRTLNEYSEDNIFIECLSGELKSYGSFLERIRNTPLKDPCKYRVVIVDVERFENFDPRKEVLRSFFNTIFRRAWMLWYRGNVVAIIDTTGISDTEAAFMEKQDFFTERNLRLGISDEFENIYYIYTYYLQGLRALSLAERFGQSQLCHMYNDYKFYDMLQKFVTGNEPKLFIDNKLAEIFYYDNTNNTEYYTTIEKYLFSGQNPSKAADELHVHKNTVSYRINKAKELFGLSFDNVEENFRLMCSYRLRHVANSCSEEDKQLSNADKFPFDFLC